MNSLTGLPVNIAFSEMLKQMPFFFHFAEALAIHPIASLPPNGLRIFKVKRRKGAICPFLFLRLTYHLQLLGAGFSEALDLHRQSTFILCFPTTHQTTSVSKPPCLGSGGVQRREGRFGKRGKENIYVATECHNILHHFTQFKKELFLEAVGNYYKTVLASTWQVKKIWKTKIR